MTIIFILVILCVITLVLICFVVDSIALDATNKKFATVSTSIKDLNHRLCKLEQWNKFTLEDK